VIRVIIFLVILGLLALGAGWVADQQGSVTIVWLGKEVTTTIGVMIWAFVAVAVAAAILWSIIRGLMRAPAAARARRQASGHRALGRGLVAVGAGDTHAAARHARDARRLLGREPVALLLDAQAAQLRGDRAAAERAFGAMAEHHETKLLGLRGLFIEAQRKGDVGAARRHAEAAAQSAPALGWAGRAVLEMRCAAGDWAGALAALERGHRAGLIDRDSYRRQRAVLLTGEAQALAGTDREAAKAAALEAVKLAPDLVPAAALAGTFLAQAGEPRRASRIVESAWRANPHPDLADVIMNLRPGDSSRQKFERIRKLAQDAIGNVEAAIAQARAAIMAQDFAHARGVLAPLLAAPTQRIAILMAELEEKEHADIGRAREWMARALTAARDPAWTADGFVSERWMPVSPSGRLDAFEWKVPLAEIPGPVIEPRTGEPARELAAPEPARPAPPPEPVRPVEPAKSPEPPVSSRFPVPPPPPAPAPSASVTDGGTPAHTDERAAVAADAAASPAHAPDDPGAAKRHEDQDADAEPPKPAKQEGWWRTLFG
jgi:HemY protein